jgi:hypothetical protein
MVLKGLAVGEPFYGDQCLRPMTDIDLLVLPAETEHASQILNAAGWPRVIRKWETSKPGGAHEQLHVNSRGGRLDLHRRMLGVCTADHALEHVWGEAREMKVMGASTLRPSAGDLLFHTIIHGLRWDQVPSIRWIADAVMILRGSEELDWKRVTNFAQRCRLAHRLFIGLNWLNGQFGAAIPSEVLADLQRSRPSFYERVEADWLVNRQSSGIHGRLRRQVGRYGRMYATYGGRVVLNAIARNTARRVARLLKPATPN